MDTVNVELFGKDPKVQKALSIARNVSVTKAPVLITGEAGIGKRSLAYFIHNNSTRTDKDVHTVDCSEDSKTVENNILGFRDDESGRFSKGVLELGNGGTVVFANIDSLEDEFQKRIHKILNELDDYDIDIRIIATTTKNLSKLVGSGRFYRGLFTFVSNNQITLPPLRERVGDLEYIASTFLTDFNTKENKTASFDRTALDKILNHYWTHNVAELKSVIEDSLESLSSSDSEEESNSITAEVLSIGEKKSIGSMLNDDNEGIRLMSLKEAEKLLIKKALVHTSENRTQAAKILGVSIRTLRNKINEYRNSGNVYFVNLR